MIQPLTKSIGISSCSDIIYNSIHWTTLHYSKSSAYIPHFLIPQTVKGNKILHSFHFPPPTSPRKEPAAEDDEQGK